MPLHWTGLWHFIQPFQHFLFFAISAGSIMLRRYWQKVRENRASGWPSADGMIQSVIVKPHNGYWVEVSYRYYVLQEYRYGKYRRHFRKKRAAEEFAAAIRGRSLQIRYREDNPNMSILMERDLEMAGALQLH